MDSVDERWKERQIRKDKHLRQESKEGEPSGWDMLFCLCLNSTTTDIGQKRYNVFAQN